MLGSTEAGAAVAVADRALVGRAGGSEDVASSYAGCTCLGRPVASVRPRGSVDDGEGQEYRESASLIIWFLSFQPAWLPNPPAEAGRKGNGSD